MLGEMREVGWIGWWCHSAGNNGEKYETYILKMREFEEDFGFNEDKNKTKKEKKTN